MFNNHIKDEDDSSDNSSEGSLEGIKMNVSEEGPKSERELAQPPRPKAPTSFLLESPYYERHSRPFKVDDDEAFMSIDNSLRKPWLGRRQACSPYHPQRLYKPRAIRCKAVETNERSSDCACLSHRFVENSSQQRDNRIDWMSFGFLARPQHQASTSSEEAAESTKRTVPVTAAQPADPSQFYLQSRQLRMKNSYKNKREQ